MTPPVTEREALERAARWPWGRLVAGVLVAAASAWLVVLLLAAEVSWVDELDRALNQAWVDAALGHAAVADLALAVTFWGNTPVVVTVTGVLVGWQWYRRRRVLATWVLATVVTGWLLNHLLKGAVNRPRPPTDGLIIDALGTSFPSGHAQVAGYGWVTFGVLALLVLRGRRRWWVAGGCWVLGVLVVVSRVVLGVHWPSDVLAGYAVGLGWALLSVAVLVRVARVRTADHAVTASPSGS